MSTLANEISKRAGWSIFMGVLQAVVGVVMIVYPVATATISVAFFGWALLVAAVAQLIYAFSSATPGSFFMKLLLGALYGIAGLALAVFPPAGVLTLTAVIGWMLVLEAIVEGVAAFALPADEGRGWMVLSSLTSLALGVMILAHWPSSSSWVIGTLLGVSLLVGGITRIVVSATVRRGVHEVESFLKAA